MSLFSRLLGTSGGRDERVEPESVRRIAQAFDELPAERARFLAAYAYLLARVAHSDMTIEATEIEAMRRSIADLSGLGPTETQLVVELALTQADEVGGTDDYLVTRAFRRLTERVERVRLLRCVLAVAAADDSITSAETSEIQKIGEELGFTRREINALRLEWRDKLAELQEVPGKG